MSFLNLAFPLRIEPRPSRWLIAMVYAVHTSVLICFASMPLEMLEIIGLSLLVFLSAIQFQRWLMRDIKLQWNTDGSWSGRIDGIDFQDARLDQQSISSRYLIWLYIVPRADSTRVIPILRGSVNRDIFRRLRVRMLIAGDASKSRMGL
ncbi:MAG: protein YgfX [Pseudomonadota bacterium]